MKNFYLIMVLLSLPAAVFAQDAVNPSEPSKRQLVLKFIDVFGTREAMEANLQEMIASLPQDSEDAKKLKEGIKVDEIIDRLVPVYEKQFSAKELQAYIDFYSSEEGKKLVRSIPVIMQESVEISATYFEEKFPDMADEPLIEAQINANE